MGIVSSTIRHHFSEPKTYPRLRNQLQLQQLDLMYYRPLINRARGQTVDELMDYYSHYWTDLDLTTATNFTQASRK